MHSIGRASGGEQFAGFPCRNRAPDLLNRLLQYPVQIFRDRAFRLFHNRLVDFPVRGSAYFMGDETFNMLPQFNRQKHVIERPVAFAIIRPCKVKVVCQY